jgi:DNA-binding NarL/FixJ family response regulator
VRPSFAFASLSLIVVIGLMDVAEGKGLQVPGSASKAQTLAPEPGAVTRIRVLLSDSVELVRQGIRRVLANQRDITVVDEADSEPHAVELTLRHLPDVVLMGVHRIQGETLRALAEIQQRVPACCVILIADEASVPDLLEAAAAGARGLLLKHLSVPRLAEAVRTAAAGGWPLEPALVRDLLQHLIARGEVDPGVVGESLQPEALRRLSPRERQVVLSLLEGRRNKEIAVALGVSVGTVKTHLRHIFRKLNVSDRTAAVLVTLQPRSTWAA